MGQRFFPGDRVAVDSGDHSGKRGIVVPRRSVEYTDTRRGAIPQVEGANSPLGIRDVLVRLDCGKIVPIPSHHLSQPADGEYPLLPWDKAS
jgi:hypothetical protein